MLTAIAGLRRMQEGNARFVAEGFRGQVGSARGTRDRRRELVGGQAPFAVILGCSDSRVPAELVFDQGLGDLFVIRVAGNVVAPSQVGSVEYAVDTFGTRLVIVMGHSDCGAVQATLQQLERPQAMRSPNLRSIVNRIRPSVEPLLTEGVNALDPQTVDRAVRANILASANHLRHGSELIEELILGDRLLVVGAEYSLETGIVDFFDGVPDPADYQL